MSIEQYKIKGLPSFEECFYRVLKTGRPYPISKIERLSEATMVEVSGVQNSKIDELAALRPGDSESRDVQAGPEQTQPNQEEQKQKALRAAPRTMRENSNSDLA